MTFPTKEGGMFISYLKGFNFFVTLIAVGFIFWDSFFCKRSIREIKYQRKSTTMK
jgi:hypothetical protein